MKNAKKIILINILLISAIFITAELISKHIEQKELVKTYLQQDKNIDISKIKLKYQPIHKFDYNKMIMSRVKNRVYKGKSGKRPIITIGCSYTYGVGLDENQTFAYKLNKYTDRTTYNRGINSSGPQLVYRQLSDINFKKQIPDAEYIIYTFLSYDHIKRLFLYSLLCTKTSENITPRYYIKNDRLTEVNPVWYNMLFFSLGRKIITLKIKPEVENEFNSDYPLFFKTMEECVKISRTKYPDSKFVLLEMTHPRSGEETNHNTCFTKEQIMKLKNLGIIYINAEELVGHDFNDTTKYRIKDKDHPNEAVWDEIVPKLSRKLNL